MIVALILIWEDDSGTSPCPGRYVKDDSSLEDNLRILSLVYTSIVTLFTILLVGTLGYEARALIHKIANGFSFLSPFFLSLFFLGGYLMLFSNRVWYCSFLHSSFSFCIHFPLLLCPSVYSLSRSLRHKHCF